jgi:hypothetical protein
MKAIHLHCTMLMLLCCFKCSASGPDFYQRFVSLVDTNALVQQWVTNSDLVDKNNTAPKLTNSVISLHKLRTEGEVGNIRLGMTMQDVVACWGKPILLHPKCDGGHRFSFTDCSLVFTGNSLSKVRFGATAVFDQGLSAQSNFKHWEDVLGQPTLRNGSTVVYEEHGKVRTVLLLTFEPNGDWIFPPALYLDPPLTNWFKKPQP